jgi:hypothetical protein
MTKRIDKAFTDRLSKAYRLYNEGRMVECHKEALGLLGYGEIPRYHRMKIFILLGAVLGDWNEANRCRFDAWALYEITRRSHRSGKDPAADKFLDQVRTEIDDLDDALRVDAPEGWNDGEVDNVKEIVMADIEDTIEGTEAEPELFNMDHVASLVVVAEAEFAPSAVVPTPSATSVVIVHGSPLLCHEPLLELFRSPR